METSTEPLIFYQNVSTSKELRDAANEAEVLLREYGIEMSMRPDVYQAKVNAEKNIKASGLKLNPEEERLVEKLLLDGKRAGLNLPEKERKELEKLKKELSQVCVEFSVSFNLDSRHFLANVRMDRKTLTRRMCAFECSDLTSHATHEGFITRVVLVSPSKSSRAFLKMLSLVIPNEKRVEKLSMMSPSKLRISSHWWASMAYCGCPRLT